MNWQERAEKAEDVLRSLASLVGAGGYNADKVDADMFEQKIRWGIGQIMERLEKAEAEIARLREQIKVEWLPVVGFEGLYEVSSNGDIRNVRTGNIAAKSLMGDGYVKANLWKKGKRKQTSAHRVVAEAFIGGIDGLEINHRNGVKTDNRVSNLEITTRSGNVNHSYYELGHIIKPILATSIATGDTTEYRSIEEAVRLGGFRSSSIYDCLNGKVKTHSGHSFSRPAAPVPAVAAKQSQNDSIAVLEEWCDKLLAEFPLLDDEGLCQEKHHCEWTLQQDRKRLHTLLQSTPQSGSEPVAHHPV